MTWKTTLPTNWRLFSRSALFRLCMRLRQDRLLLSDVQKACEVAVHLEGLDVGWGWYKSSSLWHQGFKGAFHCQMGPSLIAHKNNSAAGGVTRTTEGCGVHQRKHELAAGGKKGGWIPRSATNWLCHLGQVVFIHFLKDTLGEKGSEVASRNGLEKRRSR